MSDEQIDSKPEDDVGWMDVRQPLANRQALLPASL
jgi:hypothetical protein